MLYYLVWLLGARPKKLEMFLYEYAKNFCDLLVAYFICCCTQDLAELTVWVMREYHDPTPISLSVDEADEVSIKDVALAVAKAMKFEGEVVFDTSKADGQFKKTASNKKLRKYRPDYDFTTMEDGIQKSVDWFVENYESCRK